MDHMLAHIPSAQWCEACVKSKGRPGLISLDQIDEPKGELYMMINLNLLMLKRSGNRKGTVLHAHDLSAGMLMAMPVCKEGDTYQMAREVCRFTLNMKYNPIVRTNQWCYSFKGWFNQHCWNVRRRLLRAREIQRITAPTPLRSRRWIDWLVGYLKAIENYGVRLTTDISWNNVAWKSQSRSSINGSWEVYCDLLTDADWQGSQQAKTSASCRFINGIAVHTSSRSQHVISLSLKEFEFDASTPGPIDSPCLKHVVQFLVDSKVDAVFATDSNASRLKSRKSLENHVYAISMAVCCSFSERSEIHPQGCCKLEQECFRYWYQEPLKG